MSRPITERTIVKDMITLFKDSPCLWNPGDKEYTNKVVREKAFKALLETYRPLDEDANLYTVKRKLEFMRTVFRREHSKVLTAQATGDEYEPKLWYYPHMTFLNSVMRYPQNEHSADTSQSQDITHVDMNQISEADDDPVPKKIKFSRYSKDSDDDDEESDNADPDDERNDSYEENVHGEGTKYVVTTNRAPVAFGKAIGLQLMEMQPVQRYIAEKLISDVVYYGRLEKLNLDTSININKAWP